MLRVAVAGVLLTGLTACGICPAPGDSSSAAAPAAVTTAPAEPALPAGYLSGEGIYLVPTDITPGTYRSRGPSTNSIVGCRVSRLRDTSGTPDAVLAYQSGAGQKVVTIAPTDGAFMTQGCQPWTRIR
jgi:hypothetical protein